MNDPIKYLITGAAIAIVCGAVGTMGGVWLMKETASSQRPEIRSQKSGGSAQPSAISFQPAAAKGQPSAFSGQSSVFSGQRIHQNPVITIPPRPVNGSNVAFRPTPPTGKMPITYNQFQKVQELPEVKAARESFMEAQRRYSEAIKKAMGAKKTEDGGRGTEVRSQKSEVSGQKASEGGQSSAVGGLAAAGLSKGASLTIQVPPAGSGTNGAVKGK